MDAYDPYDSIRFHARNHDLQTFHAIPRMESHDFIHGSAWKTLMNLDPGIHNFSDKFFVRLTSTNLLNLWIYFDFKIDQPLSKYHDRKVNLVGQHVFG